jgi:hypothetical protein
MSRLESIASAPKLVAAAAGSITGAAATGAYETAPTHPMQIVVWICTAFGGLAAGVLAAINAWTALQRYLTNRRRRARYLRLKAEGKIPLP